MKEQISDKVQADGIRGPEGRPVAGGQLFQRYLLKRCQEDFERYWLAKEAIAVDAATKATEGDATKAVNEKNKEGGDQEAVLYSSEYYATQKAKRQGPGLIKFIGELFKLQMITERIMHECLQKLLADVNTPEEDIESLCQLLTAAGSLLDTKTARAHVDVYFMRMKELIRSPKVGPRMQSMLQDVIKLRERGWVTGNGDAQEEERLQRQINVSPGGSRDGDDAARSPFEAVDLSSSGETSGEAGPPTMFGPGSMFTGKKAVGKCDSLSRTSSNLSMFSMFQNASSGADEAPEARPMRKRPILLPRSKPAEQTETQQQANSEVEGASTLAAPAEMSEAVADKRVRECSKEFFGIRNLDEAEVYFTDLPAQYHHKLVDELVSAAVESTEANAQLVSDLFTRAVSKSLCSPASFEEGVTPVAEVIDDITIDVPKAFRLFAIMIKGAMFDGERRLRLASRSMDSDKLLGLLS
ncbi:ARM repeat-containing protein [Macrolepiota fuliginosa MF-IS2]|uniref:ARM repeat-containing protein n=1 Tax=Macrolepiota fuliginosa MF-IS2 TaxID=1400762 RepID=A0A9P6C3I7_9AGAR|nr:ARM repeat-containing protein [Macrolepiota fuliginosa MF-IS2]